MNGLILGRLLPSGPSNLSKGERVECLLDFFPSCPPSGKMIERGTLGTVVDSPKVVPDIFGPITMVKVQWDSGQKGDVNITLLKRAEPRQS